MMWYTDKQIFNQPENAHSRYIYQYNERPKIRTEQSELLIYKLQIYVITRKA